MFEQTSRYANIKDGYYTAPDGRVIVYKLRRFVPPAQSMPTLVEVTITDSDRLDLLAGQTLGMSEQFWRICDANNATNPLDLEREVGRVIRVPVPQP